MRRIRSLLVVLAGGALLAVAPSAANAACGTPDRRSLSGTVKGSDGRAVNVQIGFDLFDKANRPILANGCPKPSRSGYSPNLFLNTRLPATGGTGRVAWRAMLPSTPPTPSSRPTRRTRGERPTSGTTATPCAARCRQARPGSG